MSHPGKPPTSPRSTAPSQSPRPSHPGQWLGWMASWLAGDAVTTLVDTIFAIHLREKLDAETGGDKSDAAYHWGL